MRILDAMTYFSVLAHVGRSRIIFIQRKASMLHTGPANVAYHVGCLVARDPTGERNERVARAIVSCAHMYHLHLLDKVGPQPPCRHCQYEAY